MFQNYLKKVNSHLYNPVGSVEEMKIVKKGYILSKAPGEIAKEIILKREKENTEA